MESYMQKKTNIESAAGSRREKEEGEEEKEEEEEEKEEMRRAEACFSFLGQRRCKEPILPLNICVDTFEHLLEGFKERRFLTEPGLRDIIKNSRNSKNTLALRVKGNRCSIERMVSDKII
uniref:Uncharacterized protein n=1 Tax=Vespula pensylvanica TaxID=30213 RepID=A0A834PFL7_VESPE|nr:hypothetical protein H0235_001021 [Vespula pensylvanica]